MKSESYQSDTPSTATQLKCSQVQKHSKYIGKTVHVTSVAQIQFVMLREYLFYLRKENKITIYSTILLPELRLLPFWRVPKNVFNVISVVYVRGERAHERNLRNKRCLRLGESACMHCDNL